MDTALYQGWKNTPWSDPVICWQGDGFVANGFCRECRRCCGPQKGDPPYPMPLMPWQLDGKEAERFYMLDATTSCLDERGCKALGEGGCTLPRSLRPIACGLFPIVCMEGALFLYRLCPASLCLPFGEWQSMGEKAALWLRQTFSVDNLHRLSLPKPSCNHDRYIPLFLSVFEVA